MLAKVDLRCDKLAYTIGPVRALNRGESQAVRTHTLGMFNDSVNAGVVVTDVATRGIHMDRIFLVVLVDFPKDYKDYPHHSGRTARAGECGAVVTRTMLKQ